MNARTQGSPDGIPASVAVAVRSNTRFTLDLYRTQRNASGNLFLSPYSISAALAMTYAGARGATAVQMAHAMHFDLAPQELLPAFAALEMRMAEVERQGAVQLHVANRLWPHKDCRLLGEYVTLIEQSYGASLTSLDYLHAEAARQTINTWAEEQTGHKIRDLVPPGVLNELTRLVLANAIYFKGDWASRFRLRFTRCVPFWVTPDSTVQAQMMEQTHKFGYAETDEMQALEMPYAGGALSMIVLLPRARDGLASLEAALTAENLDRWTAGLRPEEVQVSLPRFEITFGVLLDAALQSLGMADAFSERADFSGMDGARRLYIGAVLHKAFVKVNEEGTEAAAATVVMTLGAGLPPPLPVFRADHPFLFLIREVRTGSILFLGRVLNPHLPT
jgi:serine protease inhibitor